MTKQQIFDTVVNHFKAQKVQAVYEDTCVYRAPDGKRCAAGILIPDKYYRETMEGHSFGRMGVTGQLPKSLTRNTPLIEQLQTVHDRSDEDLLTRNNYLKLEEIAQIHKLDTEVLDKFIQIR